MKKNSPEKYSKYQTEDAYRLVITAGIITIAMVILIRFNAHTFIADKLIVSPNQHSQSNQSDESDITTEPIPLLEPSEQIE